MLPQSLTFTSHYYLDYELACMERGDSRDPSPRQGIAYELATHQDDTSYTLALQTPDTTLQRGYELASAAPPAHPWQPLYAQANAETDASSRETTLRSEGGLALYDMMNTADYDLASPAESRLRGRLGASLSETGKTPQSCASDTFRRQAVHYDNHDLFTGSSHARTSPEYARCAGAEHSVSNRRGVKRRPFQQESGSDCEA